MTNVMADLGRCEVEAVRGVSVEVARGEVFGSGRVGIALQQCGVQGGS
jgi:hypothetical protein